MRIISKFHDYYDTAMGMGIDPNLIYRRETNLIDVYPWQFDAIVPEALRIGPRSIGYPQVGVLAFCGRYRLVWLNASFPRDTESFGSHSSQSAVLATEEVAREYARAIVSRYRRRRMQEEEEVADELRKRFTNIEQGMLAASSFRAFECPTYLAFEHVLSRFPQWGYDYDWNTPRQIRVITNPRLATLGFQHVVDSFTAFQEISMFLGSQLAPEDRAPRTSGDDKTIAAAKGFDEQSFRTQAPGQKKLNRMANRSRKRSSSGE